MTGKKYLISGTAIEIVSKDGERWKTRNITMKETVFIKKQFFKMLLSLARQKK